MIEMEEKKEYCCENLMHIRGQLSVAHDSIDKVRRESRYILTQNDMDILLRSSIEILKIMNRLSDKAGVI